LFEELGWAVVPFSMHHPDNEPTEWARYFVDESRAQESRSPLSRGVRALNAIYSNEAARRVGELVDVSRPDVAHAHNIYHHLSPSVLVELSRRGIPVVLTLHDLKLACPAYKMYSHGAVCEKCRGGALRHVITNRCIKGSLAMSSLVWLESTVHRLLDVYHKNVTRFVVPSRFLLAKLAEWGIDTTRFTHVPNSVDVDALTPQGEPGEAFVYLGRLMPEKGVATLVRAAAQARVRLRIVGTGPEETHLRHLAAELGSDVEFAGYLSGSALKAAISSARAVVLSSELYENAPLSALESSALARPVIGADIGGIPELIRHEETGFVYRSGNVDSLVEALTRAQRLPVEALARMGRAAREWMRTEFSPMVYRERMLTIYRSLLPSVN
jgi:glycosyltransferase involved in cell wall biosynthesis